MSTPTQTAFERFRAGDTAAFDDVVAEYTGVAYGVALRILGDGGLAEEAVQDALVRVWQQASTFDPTRGNERPWILTVVRNQAIDLVRKRARLRERSIEEAPSVYELRDPDDVWQKVLDSLTTDQVEKALGELPHEQAETVRLAYLQGIRPVDIGREQGVAEGTVRSRLRLGLARLRDLLAGAPEEVGR